MIPRIARAVPELAPHQAGFSRTPHKSSNLSRCGTKLSPHATEDLGNGRAVVDATSQHACVGNGFVQDALHCLCDGSLERWVGADLDGAVKGTGHDRSFLDGF